MTACSPTHACSGRAEKSSSRESPLAQHSVRRAMPNQMTEPLVDHAEGVRRLHSAKGSRSSGTGSALAPPARRPGLRAANCRAVRRQAPRDRRAVRHRAVGRDARAAIDGATAAGVYVFDSLRAEPEATRPTPH